MGFTGIMLLLESAAAIYLKYTTDQDANEGNQSGFFGRNEDKLVPTKKVGEAVDFMFIQKPPRKTTGVLSTTGDEVLSASGQAGGEVTLVKAKGDNPDQEVEIVMTGDMKFVIKQATSCLALKENGEGFETGKCDGNPRVLNITLMAENESNMPAPGTEPKD